MAQGASAFPWGKVAALGVVVGLTFLPVVSCGPLVFQGHELLRNVPPDVSGLGAGMSDGLGKLTSGMPGFGERPDPPSASHDPTPPMLSERDAIFEGSEAWMHWLYVGVFLCGLIALLLPAGARAKALVAGAGGVGLVVFLSRFESAITSDSKDANPTGGLSMFEWDTGAYVAMAGFVLVVVDGLRRRVGGSATSPPPGG